MRARGLAAVVLAVALAVPLASQTTRFKTGTAAVRVDALVTDGNRPVRGLTSRDFELRDNGIVQDVTDVSHETLPLNIIAVLDLSASVKGPPLVRLKEAMQELIDALGTDDRAALVTFSHRMAGYTRLTGDREKLRQEVAAARAEGTTALLDATFAGLALRETDPGRTLLVLFSDGRDTASWLTARQVIESARRTDVVIYPIVVRLEFSGPGVLADKDGFGRFIPMSGMRPRPDNDEADRLLEAFADETGGRVFRAEGERTLRKTLTDVLTEFRQRYVLSYTPSGVVADGWHTLDVKLRGRGGQVKARRGYFAATRAEEARTPK